jgi:hypothetical protein
MLNANSLKTAFNKFRDFEAFKITNNRLNGAFMVLFQPILGKSGTKAPYFG